MKIFKDRLTKSILVAGTILIGGIGSQSIAAESLFGSTLVGGSSADIALSLPIQPSYVQPDYPDEGGGGGGGGGGSGPSYIPPRPAVSQAWMHSDVPAAWSQGYLGQGTNIIVVDWFASNDRKFVGNLGEGYSNLTHGQWTSKEAGMVAPSARIYQRNIHDRSAVNLPSGFNVLNLSYGVEQSASTRRRCRFLVFNCTTTTYWKTDLDNRDTSIVNAAVSGRAVVVKAAGNERNTVTVDGVFAGNKKDKLNLRLIGAQSAIFVGSLSKNGSPTAKASMAYYSTVAGTNPTVQRQFLVVGVESNRTNLSGTSFAAPIVSGYAAVLHSKFTTASPTAVTRQLLNTARTDTVVNYNPAIYGKGEASLSRALAPASIQ